LALFAFSANASTRARPILLFASVLLNGTDVRAGVVVVADELVAEELDAEELDAVEIDADEASKARTSSLAASRACKLSTIRACILRSASDFTIIKGFDSSGPSLKP
jgi:hypothetical protein